MEADADANACVLILAPLGPQSTVHEIGRPRLPVNAYSARAWIQRVWRQEMELVELTGQGTTHWSNQQVSMISRMHRILQGEKNITPFTSAEMVKIGRESAGFPPPPTLRRWGDDWKLLAEKAPDSRHHRPCVGGAMTGSYWQRKRRIPATTDLVSVGR